MVEKRRKILGKEHVDTITAMKNLAVTLYAGEVGWSSNNDLRIDMDYLKRDNNDLR